MSKALIIKGANFSENRVAKVNIVNPVPCTGITLDESTITSDSFEDITITATVAPSGCTDEVYWTSSDESVATVEDGVVSIHALGTATITATCGDFSDSCVITIDNIEITAFEWGSAENSNGNDNFATGNVPSSYKKVYYADKVPLDSTRLRLSRNANFVGDFNLAPTMLPDGVNSVELISNNVSGMYHVLFYDSAQSSTSAGCALIVGKNRPSAPTNGVVDNTFNVPEGADSFTIGLTYKTQYESTDDPATVIAANGTKIILKSTTAATT